MGVCDDSDPGGCLHPAREAIVGQGQGEPSAEAEDGGREESEASCWECWEDATKTLTRAIVAKISLTSARGEGACVGFGFLGDAQ